MDSLVVSASQDAGGYEISRQNNLKLPYPYVDWDILHWYACSADGRSVGRSDFDVFAAKQANQRS